MCQNVFAKINCRMSCPRFCKTAYVSELDVTLLEGVDADTAARSERDVINEHIDPTPKADQQVSPVAKQDCGEVAIGATGEVRRDLFRRVGSVAIHLVLRRPQKDSCIARNLHRLQFAATFGLK